VALKPLDVFSATLLRFNIYSRYSYFPLIEEFLACSKKPRRMRIDRRRLPRNAFPNPHYSSRRVHLPCESTSKATQTALLLFSVAVQLAGGTAAVRGQCALDGFDPNANAGKYAGEIERLSLRSRL
jgi:hypothetical protein